MFLLLAHTKLNAYKVSEELTLECYKLTGLLPSDEKFAMVQQIRRAALSVHLNIAEGSSRQSDVERRRYFEIARGSVVEIDAAIGIAHKLMYLNNEQLATIGDLIIKSFKLLSGMINNKQ
jgi:four helix bundle protein